MNCPSCGGELDWDQRFAHLVVCPYCASSVVVDEEALRLAGKMNVLAVPDGPLFVGAHGKVGGHTFEVLGRIRYGYGRGFWDEWFLALDDGRTAWISQDEGDFSFEFLREDLQATDELLRASPGDVVHLAGKAFHVEERDRAVCEGGEGQLPFDLEVGHEIEYLDLGAVDRSASVELEQDGAGGKSARVFVGRDLPVSAIHLEFTAQEAGVAPPEATQATSSFFDERLIRDPQRAVNLKCASCAHPLELDGSEGDEVACRACGSVIDLTAPHMSCVSCHETIAVHGGDRAEMVICPHCRAQQTLTGSVPEVLAQLKDKQRKGPRVPFGLGTRCTLRGVEWQLVGHLRYHERDEGVDYWSDEFLLHAKSKGYAWLMVENGHFAFAEEVRGIPKRAGSLVQKSSFQALGRTFKAYERGRCEIAWVDGELPWVAREGDKIRYLDAISPPYMLSAELSDSESEWFRCEYLSQREVAAAFGLSKHQLPYKKGVGAAEPYERGAFRGAALRVMTTTVVVALLLLLLDACASGRTVETLRIDDPGKLSGYVTEPFTIRGEGAIVELDCVSLVDNAWLWVGGAVIDAQDQVLLETSASVSYYHGVSGGESWSEGSQSDSVVFQLEEPGEYRLLLDGEAGSGNDSDGRGGPPLHITVSEGVVLSRYYVLLFVGTLLWVLGEWLHRMSFEARRWAPVTED